MIDDLRAALRTGGRSLLDPAIWRDLVLAPFSLAVLGRAIAWIVVVVIAGFVSVLLHGWIGQLLAGLVGLAMALWLDPLVMRCVSAIVVRHAFGPDVATQPVPPASAYRHWWAPLIVATQAIPGVLGWLGLGDGWLQILALLAVQTLLVPGAVVRTVLAPALPPARLESTLATHRVLWAVIAFGWLALWGVLEAMTPVLYGLGALKGALTAWGTGSLGSFLLARIAVAIAVTLAIAIFCIAGLARFALSVAAPEQVGDDDGPGTAPAPSPSPSPAPAPVPASASAPAPRPGPAARPVPGDGKGNGISSRAGQPSANGAKPSARRRRPTRTAPWKPALIALAVVAGGVFLLRGQIAYWALGAQTRDEFVQGMEWSQPYVRQMVRTKLACLGKADKLRVLSWGGIRGDGSDEDAALACAAYHGHVAAVRVLVAAGDDVDRAVTPMDSERGVAPQTPLQLAVRTPAGLPVADWLLSRRKKPWTPVAGQADLVQVAAAWNCMECIEWLHDRGMPMDARAPATPLALWLDQRSQDDRADVGELPRLIELGLSPSAVGEDGRSALHAAAADANGPAIDLLIAHGADPAQVDADGMTPLLYAARRLYQVNPGESEAQTSRRARRVAVIVKLIPLTPSHESGGVEHRGKRTIVATSPYIEGVPVDFERAAAIDPAIRAALDQSAPGSPADSPDVLAHLPPDQLLARLDAMDGAQLAAVLHPSAKLTAVAADAGGWRQLLRAMHGWQALPQSAGGSLPDCRLLDIAMAGQHDSSRDQADSWDLVVAWLDSGRKLKDCGGPSRYLQGDLQRRSRAQQADWATRTGGTLDAR